MKPSLYLIILLNRGCMSTFLSLCEPCSIFFVIDKTLLLYFPSINTVVDFKGALSYINPANRNTQYSTRNDGREL